MRKLGKAQDGKQWIGPSGYAGSNRGVSKPKSTSSAGTTTRKSQPLVEAKEEEFSNNQYDYSKSKSAFLNDSRSFDEVYRPPASGGLIPFDPIGDSVNPLAVIESLGSIPGQISEGDYFGAGMNALEAFPFARSLRGVPKSVGKAADQFGKLDKDLLRIKNEGLKKGLSEAEIAKNQMDKLGITSKQRKAYVPGVSELLTEYIQPYAYENATKRVLQIPKKILFGEKNSKILSDNLDDVFLSYNTKNPLISTNRYDAWRLYSGLPQKHNTFRIAETAPVNHPSYTPKQLKDLEIFSINSEKRLLDELPNVQDLHRYSYYDPKYSSASDLDFLKNTKQNVDALNNSLQIKLSDFNTTNIMGGHNLRFHDGLMEYNDIWDLSPNNIKLEKFFGKPFMSHGVLKYDPNEVSKLLDGFIRQREKDILYKSNFKPFKSNPLDLGNLKNSIVYNTKDPGIGDHLRQNIKNLENEPVTYKKGGDWKGPDGYIGSNKSIAKPKTIPTAGVTTQKSLPVNVEIEEDFDNTYRSDAKRSRIFQQQLEQSKKQGWREPASGAMVSFDPIGDAVNPLEIINSISSIPTQIAEGNYLEAGMNSLELVPFLKSLRGFKLPNITKSKVDTEQLSNFDNKYEDYFNKLNIKEHELQKLHSSGKINYETYVADQEKYQQELLKDLGVGSRLGSGSFGKVYEFADDPSKVIKLGDPYGNRWTPELIESLKSVKQNANIAIPYEVQDFEVSSMYKNYQPKKKQVVIMPNLNKTSAQNLNLNKRDRYALFLKQARQLRDRGIALGVKNHENFKLNKDKGVFDIYDINPSDIENPVYYMQYIKDRTKEKLLDNMLYKTGGSLTKYQNKEEKASKYQNGGTKDKDTDSWVENIAEIIDPTGITSWDDVYRAYSDTGLSSDTAWEVVGALPLVGKFGKVAKTSGQLLRKAALDPDLLKLRSKNGLPAGLFISGAIGGIGTAPYWGRLSDAFQAVVGSKDDSGFNNKLTQDTINYKEPQFNGRNIFPSIIGKGGSEFKKDKQFGKYQTGGSTDYNINRAEELGYTPDETGHLPSVDYTNGMWLKSKKHPTAFMEFLQATLNPELKNQQVVVNPEGYFGNEQLQYIPRKQSGGNSPIVDPRGQYNHPGKTTRIPSNRITMKDVGYPVLGITNKGTAAVMFPGEEYLYTRADFVDEIPLGR